MGLWRKLLGRSAWADQPEFIQDLVKERVSFASIAILDELQERFQFLPDPAKLPSLFSGRRPSELLKTLVEQAFKASMHQLAHRALSAKDYATCETASRLALDIWPDDLAPHTALAFCYGECGRMSEAHDSAVFACQWLQEARTVIASEGLEVPSSGNSFLSADRYIRALACDQTVSFRSMADVVELVMCEGAEALAGKFRDVRKQFFASLAAALCGADTEGIVAPVATGFQVDEESLIETVGFQMYVASGRVGKMEYMHEEAELPFYRLVLERLLQTEGLRQQCWSWSQRYEKMGLEHGPSRPLAALLSQLIRLASTGRSPEEDMFSVADVSKRFFSETVSAVDQTLGATPCRSSEP